MKSDPPHDRDVDRPWSAEVQERREREQRFPMGDLDERSGVMPPAEFDALWGKLEEALPGMSAWQLMTLHSSVGWERDIRGELDRRHPERVRRSWAPWSELRRRTHIEFRWCADISAPGLGHRIAGLIGPQFRRTWVVHMHWNARPDTLTHELTHDDRGIPCGPGDDPAKEAEEDVVRRITAERSWSAQTRTAAPTLARVLGSSADRLRH